MRIIFLMTGIDYGGASKSILYLLKSIIKYAEIESFVITQFCNSLEIKNEIEKYCKQLIITNFPHINANQAYSTSLRRFKKIINKDYKKLFNIIQEIRPDIVHFNSTTLTYLLKPLKEFAPEIKTVVHLREVISNPNKSKIADYLIKSIKRYSDYSIAISDNEIIPFGELKNCLIIPNPIDIDECSNLINSYNKVAYNDECIKIGMMAAFHKSKGHLNFSRALSIINKSTSYNFIGYIMGVRYPKRTLRFYIKRILKKDFFTNLLKYIYSNELIEKVILIPQNYSVLTFLNTLDIYVRPSNAGDPWGRDIIEAMAMKKPVVATGSSEFFIENGKTGYLVPPNNAEIMAEKIIDLIKNPLKRENFGEMGYEKIKEMCDIKEYGARIYKLYTSLLN